MKPLYIYILSGLAVAAAIYFFMKKKKEAGTLETNPNENSPTLVSNPNGGTTATTPATTERIIKKGSSGNDVKIIQNHFNAARQYAISQGITPPNALAVDGNFGQATENALLFMYGYKQITPTDFIDYRYNILAYPLNWLYTYQRYTAPATAPNLGTQIGSYAL